MIFECQFGNSIATIESHTILSQFAFVTNIV